MEESCARWAGLPAAEARCVRPLRRSAMTSLRARTLLLVLAVVACHREKRGRPDRLGSDTARAEPVVFPDSNPPAGLVYGDAAVALSGWARSRHKPWFDDYLVAPDRRPGPPFALSSARVRHWHSTILAAIRGGPDFAGRFRLQPLPAGAEAFEIAVLDFTKGKVYFPDIPCCASPLWRADSRLMIDDPTVYNLDTLGHPSEPWIRYYLWTGQAFALIDSLDASDVRVARP